MKRCPVCEESYNDTWKVCLRDDSPLLGEGEQIRETAYVSRPQSSSDQKNKDVGGWLALYVWALLLGGPIGLVMVLYTAVTGNGNFIYPMGLPQYLNFVYAALVFAEIMGAILLLIPKPMPVLYVRGVMTMWVLFRVACAYMMKDKGLGEIVSNLLVAALEALWLLYFIFSKRVKSRYYPELAPAKENVSAEKSLSDFLKKF